MTRAPAAAPTNPVALAKRAGCMLAGEDFILRRAKAEPTGREVITHIDDSAFADLVLQSRSAQMTPARFARCLIERGLAGAGDVRPATVVARIGEPVSGEVEKIAGLERANGSLRQEISDLHHKLAGERRTIALRDEKIVGISREIFAAHGERDEARRFQQSTFADLSAAQETIVTLEGRVAALEAALKDKAEKARPIVTLQAKRPLSENTEKALGALAEAAQDTFKHRYAPDAPDDLSGMADCTRRMIIALAASGLNPKAIARETETPANLVKAVLDQRQKRGGAA